ncbi:uncharacterized protein LOC115941450 [Leptonychotes weddellii]|uniref:Uncharacterized protein LOC115941450 n=1 Tax=Leptonychotes weddellii TaxID=9713 RepID=A0A7F8QWT5_LEPWE|nr:uncharacterized protein LOC115941450 [Leptonychotes weddellii]
MHSVWPSWGQEQKLEDREAAWAPAKPFGSMMSFHPHTTLCCADKDPEGKELSELVQVTRASGVRRSGGQVAGGGAGPLRASPPPPAAGPAGRMQPLCPAAPTSPGAACFLEEVKSPPEQRRRLGGSPATERGFVCRLRRARESQGPARGAAAVQPTCAAPDRAGEGTLVPPALAAFCLAVTLIPRRRETGACNVAPNQERPQRPGRCENCPRAQKTGLRAHLRFNKPCR